MNLRVIRDNVNEYDQCGTWICAIFIMSIAAVIGGFSLFQLGNSNVSMYGIVIDAGSVHTSLSLYEWPAKKLNGTGEVKEILNCEISSYKGISRFVRNPSEVQKYLSDNFSGSSCLSDAVSKIGDRYLKSYGNVTTVFLGATGGMRALNNSYPEITKEIMCNASTALYHIVKEQPTTSCNLADIIPGKEEGKFGWVTVNYLMGSLQRTSHQSSEKSPQRELGALDWGGASSQITFPVDESTDAGPNIEDATFFNHTTKIFSMSNMCYGQSEALNRYFVHLIHQEFLKTGEIKSILKSPCQPHSKNRMYSLRANRLFGQCTKLKDNKFEEAVNKLNKSTLFRFVAENNINACLDIVDSQFDYNNCTSTYDSKNVCMDTSVIPKAKSNTEFLAFSTYWYLVDALSDMLVNENRKLVTSKSFTTATHALCLETAEKHSLLRFGENELIQNTCFRALYMERLLSKGYGFQDWKNIRFVSTVEGQSVGWTLGYMLEATKQYPSIDETETITNILSKPVSWVYITPIFSLVIMLFVATSKFVKQYRVKHYNAL